jgi:hypothetical protein
VVHAEGSQSTLLAHRDHEIDRRKAAAERALHDGSVEIQPPGDFRVLPHLAQE